jgi:enoyl-CoA hydratase/carnithine racemase
VSAWTVILAVRRGSGEKRPGAPAGAQNRRCYTGRVAARPADRAAGESRVDYTEILYDVADDGVATLTLNRPEKMNAFSTTMIQEWAHAIEQARDDANVKVLVVTGAGRGFCSGMDIQAEVRGAGVLRTETGPADRRNSLRYNVHRVARALQLLDKPYIAALNGPAAGAGMDMASMADLRFAAEGARFGMAYVRMGLIPGDGGAFFLPRIVGIPKALELIWTGDMFDAQEALRIGYVTKVFPADQLQAETHAFAARLAEGPGVAIQLAKRLVYRSSEVTQDQALELAQSAMIVAQSTDDAKEGPRAFSEKRKPNFQSR